MKIPPARAIFGKTLLGMVLGVCFVCAEGVATQALSQNSPPKSQADKLYRLSLAEFADKSRAHLALKHINDAIALEPSNALFWRSKTAILMDQQEDEETLKAADKTLQLNPENPYDWMVKAMALTHLKRFPEALIAADKSVKLKRTDYNSLVKSDILTSLNRKNEAEAELDTIVKSNPDNIPPRSHRADLAFHLSHYNKVIEDTTWCIEHSPPTKYGHWQTLKQRADAYMQLKQYDKAIADYKAAIKQNPDDRIFHEALLSAYKHAGNESGVKSEQTILKSIDGDLVPIK